VKTYPAPSERGKREEKGGGSPIERAALARKKMYKVVSQFRLNVRHISLKKQGGGGGKGDPYGHSRLKETREGGKKEKGGVSAMFICEAAERMQ